MTTPAAGLALALAKMERRHPWPSQARQEFLRLPYHRRTTPRNVDMVVEGDHPSDSIFLENGVLSRAKIVPDGGRQIVSLHVPGDMVDLQSLIVTAADHRVGTCTRCTTLHVAHRHLSELIEQFPEIGRALWFDTLVDAAIYREWALNVGRRDGRRRVAHLLLELGYRCEKAGIGQRSKFTLAITQVEMADATGMTPVHVSRVLSWLRTHGVMDWNGGTVTVPDWAAAAHYANFDPLYLHAEGLAAATDLELSPG